MAKHAQLNKKGVKKWISFVLARRKNWVQGQTLSMYSQQFNVEDFTLKTAQRCSRATKNVSNMGLTDQHDSCGVSMVA